MTSPIFNPGYSQKPGADYYHDSNSNQNYSQDKLSNSWNTNISELNQQFNGYSSYENNAKIERSGLGTTDEPKPYESFIRNKVEAFDFFANSVGSIKMLQGTDIKEVNSLRQNRRYLLRFVYFGMCFASFAVDESLRRNYLLYGMTYRNSIPKNILKFWFIPLAMTSLCSETLADWLYGNKIRKIVDKYDFSENEFRSIYEKEAKKSA